MFLSFSTDLFINSTISKMKASLGYKNRRATLKVVRLTSDSKCVRACVCVCWVGGGGGRLKIPFSL